MIRNKERKRYEYAIGEKIAYDIIYGGESGTFDFFYQELSRRAEIVGGDIFSFLGCNKVEMEINKGRKGKTRITMIREQRQEGWIRKIKFCDINRNGETEGETVNFISLNTCQRNELMILGSGSEGKSTKALPDEDFTVRAADILTRINGGNYTITNPEVKATTSDRQDKRRFHVRQLFGIR